MKLYCMWTGYFQPPFRPEKTKVSNPKLYVCVRSTSTISSPVVTVVLLLVVTVVSNSNPYILPTEHLLV